jgi:hypothetical protein
MLVRGLPLPRELVALIRAGRWTCPADRSRLDDLFPDRSEFCCYTVAGMEGETALLDRGWNPRWHGTPDPANPPGDIDAGRTVFIADLGIGYDQPVALDYRPSVERPRVLILRWDKPAPPVPWEHVPEWRAGQRTFDPATTERLQEWWDWTALGGWNRWVEVAPDFATFAAMAGLTDGA